jgi:hypothetical protein
MAVQFRLDATGAAGVGGGVPSQSNLSHWAAGTPAFYTLVLLVALVAIIVVVGHSLR